MTSISVNSIGPGPTFLLGLSSFALCFIVRAASEGRRTISAPVPRLMEFVELERTCAGIAGKGGGDWVENAQNRLGDLEDRSLDGGGGVAVDLGLREGSTVSDPNDDVESRSEEGGG